MTCHAFRTASAGALALALAMPGPAHAQLPDGVRAMIEAAMETGDEKQVATVIALARKTQPNEAEEINGLEKIWKERHAEAVRLAKEEKIEKIREADLFDMWSGESQIGAFQSSGNSDNLGLSAALKLKREGIDWSHSLKATSDYQRSNGVTSREQFVFAYEPRYQISKPVFAYGLAQYERDRFQGLSGRYALSGGIGYKVVNSDDFKLAVKAGPALRITQFTDNTNDERLAALFGADFDWKITDRLAFSQDANVVSETGGAAQIIIDSANTSINLLSALDVKISDRMKSRLSYSIEYDSAPPAGAVSTDTMTRFLLVYGF